MRVQQLPTTVHANRFHVAVGLFVNGSQTGRQNVVKKKSGIRGASECLMLLSHFDVMTVIYY